LINGLRREVIVRFVDIDGIVDHHCLVFLVISVSVVIYILMILAYKKHNACIESKDGINECYSRNDHIGGVIASMLASSAVDRGFEPQSGQTKDDKIGICTFSAKHAALRRTSKDWLVRNQNNMSE
jgi:hypothetical protein